MMEANLFNKHHYSVEHLLVWIYARTKKISYCMFLILVIMVMCLFTSCSIRSDNQDDHIFAENNHEHDIAIVIPFNEIYAMIMAYEPRLEPFIYEFFIQLNELVLIFTDALYYQNVNHIEQVLSHGIMFVKDGDFGKANQFRTVFSHIIYGHADSLVDWNWMEHIMGSPMNTGAFIVSTPRHNNALNVGVLFRHEDVVARPTFDGLFIAEHFPNLILAFQVNVAESTFDTGWNRNFAVYVRLENLQFKIVDIVTE